MGGTPWTGRQERSCIAVEHPLKRSQSCPSLRGLRKMKLNRARVIERLQSGERLKECGNTMMFPNGDFCTAAIDIYLREKGLVTVTGEVGRTVYSWKLRQERAS